MFDLRPIDVENMFSDEELAMFRKHTDPNYTIELSEAELSEQKKHRAANLNVKLAQEEEKAEKAHEERQRRAQSYLDSGKLLLKKDNRSGAKKQFEKAIAEAPDSDPAKEAKKLIDELP